VLSSAYWEGSLRSLLDEVVRVETANGHRWSVWCVYHNVTIARRGVFVGPFLELQILVIAGIELPQLAVHSGGHSGSQHSDRYPEADSPALHE